MSISHLRFYFILLLLIHRVLYVCMHSDQDNADHNKDVGDVKSSESRTSADGN